MTWLNVNVIQRIVNPCFLRWIPSYDVGSGIWQTRPCSGMVLGGGEGRSAAAAARGAAVAAVVEVAAVRSMTCWSTAHWCTKPPNFFATCTRMIENFDSTLPSDTHGRTTTSDS